MPELQKPDLENFERCELKPDEIKYKDKAREKQRQANLASQQQKRSEAKRFEHIGEDVGW